jgi:hypothetical protein
MLIFPCHLRYSWPTYPLLLCYSHSVFVLLPYVLWEMGELIWYGDQITGGVTKESGFDRWLRNESPYSARTGSGSHPSAYLVGIGDKAVETLR